MADWVVAIIAASVAHIALVVFLIGLQQALGAS